MPSLTLEEVRLYCPFTTTIFVETGTYMGDTINNVKDAYDEVYSIELDAGYAARAIARFQNDKHIYIVNGDSAECLAPICRSIKSPAFFWLDGHWSGGDTGRGAKDCPLIEEVTSIMENCRTACVLAIDDVRLFGTYINEDWSSITRDTILKLVESRLESCKYYPSHLHQEDRMVLALRPLT
jgi:hypothetical protein